MVPTGPAYGTGNGPIGPSPRLRIVLLNLNTYSPERASCMYYLLQAFYVHHAGLIGLVLVYVTIDDDSPGHTREPPGTLRFKVRHLSV